MAAVFDTYAVLLKFQSDLTGARKFQKAIKQSKVDVLELGNTVASTAMKIGAVSALIAAPIINVNIKLDQQRKHLQAVLKMSAEEQAAMEAQAKRLGATTAKTTSEVTRLQLAYAKLGLTVEEIQGITDKSVAYGIAHNIPLENVTAVLNQIYRAYPERGLQGANDMLDAMTFIANNTAATGDSFRSAFIPSLALGSQLGIAPEQMAAMIGTVMDMGLPAEMVGTGMRNIMSRITKLKFTGAQMRAAESAGIDLMGMRDRLIATGDMLEVIQVFAQLGDKFGVPEASGLFRQRGMNIAMIMKQASTRIAELEAGAKKAAGATEEMEKTMTSGLYGSWVMLKNVVEALTIALGDAGLNAAAQAFFKTLHKLIEGFTKLPKGMQRWVVYLIVAGVTVGILGVALKALILTFTGLHKAYLLGVALQQAWTARVVVSTVAAKGFTGALAATKVALGATAVAIKTANFAAFIAGLKALTVATWAWNVALWANPVTWVVAAIIAALALVAVAVWYYWDELKEAWDAIKKLFNQFLDWLMYLPRLAHNSGNMFVRGLAQGIISGIPLLGPALNLVGAFISKFMPKSDADLGPLRNLTNMGRSMITTFIEGMTMEHGTLQAAMAANFGSLQAAPALSAGPGQGLYGGYHGGGRAGDRTVITMGDINYDIDTQAHEEDVRKITQETLGEMMRGLVSDADSGELA